MVERWGISVEATNAALGARLDLKAYEAESATYCRSTEKKPDTTAHEIAHASAPSRIAPADRVQRREGHEGRRALRSEVITA
jgi:hypothetical protein